MKMINNHEALGFMWIGRIAVVMYSYDEKEPTLKIDRMYAEVADALNQDLGSRNILYSLETKIFTLVNTPKPNEKYRVKV